MSEDALVVKQQTHKCVSTKYMQQQRQCKSICFCGLERKGATFQGLYGRFEQLYRQSWRLNERERKRQLKRKKRKRSFLYQQIILLGIKPTDEIKSRCLVSFVVLRNVQLTSLTGCCISLFTTCQTFYSLSSSWSTACCISTCIHNVASTWMKSLEESIVC